MDDYQNENLVNATELIPNRFYFVSIKSTDKPRSTSNTHFFSIDNELVYESFFGDFGPLNISMLYHYCVKVNKKLKSSLLENKKIVHYTTYNEKKRANAAFLACSYCVIYLNYTSDQLCELLAKNNSSNYVNFRDASVGIPYTISLRDCLCAIHKAMEFGFFNFNDFDFMEYEHYERVENGDLNWIVPGKFIGFCGPHNKSRTTVNGYPLHAPETYFAYFRRYLVTTIIRLNKKMYDAAKFTKAGFVHKDLYFIDGSTPSDKILNQFIGVCERTDGAIAVHCKAGLGRTGSLIACYIMKHYKFTACEAIAWIRICRPGSIIGHQQVWLESKQDLLWKAGEQYRLKNGITEPCKHYKGIYSFSHTPERPRFQKVPWKKNDVSGILQKVDTMQLEDQDNAEDVNDAKVMTQGDHLNQVKAQRRARQTRHITNTIEKKMLRSRMNIKSVDNPSLVRVGKIFGVGIKDTGASTSRTILKRNGANDRQVSLRRTNQRKAITSSTKSATIPNGPTKTRITRRTTSPKEATPIRVDVSANNGNISNLNVADVAVESKPMKRVKRSLTFEREKINSRSVKVLRRTRLQTSADSIGTLNLKIHLPHVNKSSTTP